MLYTPAKLLINLIAYSDVMHKVYILYAKAI